VLLLLLLLLQCILLVRRDKRGVELLLLTWSPQPSVSSAFLPFSHDPCSPFLCPPEALWASSQADTMMMPIHTHHGISTTLLPHPPP
jgi:hypothetical protein